MLADVVAIIGTMVSAHGMVKSISSADVPLRIWCLGASHHIFVSAVYSFTNLSHVMLRREVDR